MPKWCKAILAILLLPVCVGAVQALWRALQASGDATTVWVAILGGAACWVVIYSLLPKPMWMYVLGHEFTHAIWTWLFWGKVNKIKVRSSGGHVIVTRNNFLIALAPYFFPFYAVLVVLAFLAGNWIWNWVPYAVWFHLLLGAAYACHVTLTWHVLQTRQTDITEQGYLFSAVVIFLGNVSALLIGVPLLAGKMKVSSVLGWWLDSTRDVLWWLGGRFH